MLVFLKANLVLFSIPKTGSTAYHTNLKKRADIAFSVDPRCKHMAVRQYEKHVSPYLRKTFHCDPERIAVIREPLDRLGSWYRYRLRDGCKHRGKSTKSVTFDEFIEAFLKKEDRPAFAKLGTQLQFLATRRGKIRVDHIFAAERTDLLEEFLSRRLEISCDLDTCNVSTRMKLDLDADLERRLRESLVDDFELHHRVMEAGGYLSDCRETLPKQPA